MLLVRPERLLERLNPAVELCARVRELLSSGAECVRLLDVYRTECGELDRVS